MMLVMIGTAGAGNLLTNGGFEDPAGGVIDPLDVGWVKWWATWNCNVYADDPIEGDHCGAVYWHDAGILQTVSVGPGMYEFGGKIMTTDGMVNRRGLLQAEIGGLELQLDIVPGDAINTWFVKSGIIDNTTLGATSITINLLMDSYDVDPSGVVLYDDIYLGPLGISKQAKFPVPADGAIVPPDANDLSWQNPDPNNPIDDAIACDVYFEEDDGDPNFASEPIAVGLEADTINLTDAGQTITPNTTYTWRVDCTDPHGDPNTGGSVTTQGEVWTFTATNDYPPVVTVGSDQYLWISMDDGDADPSKVTFTLNGQVSDDGESQVSTLWTLDDSEQDPATVVTIADPNSEFTASGTTNVDTSVTIDGTGLFTFLLEADDGLWHDEGTVTVIVYETCAEAATEDPDDTYDATGDINGDCKKDLADLALLAAGWLDCNSSKITCLE